MDRSSSTEPRGNLQGQVQGETSTPQTRETKAVDTRPGLPSATGAALGLLGQHRTRGGLWGTADAPPGLRREQRCAGLHPGCPPSPVPSLLPTCSLH